MNMRRGVQPQENTIYDRMAELVWEYISEQPIVKLACEATVRADVATLLDQVDHISDAEDEGTEEVAPAELNRSTRKKRGLQTTGGVS